MKSLSILSLLLLVGFVISASLPVDDQDNLLDKADLLIEASLQEYKSQVINEFKQSLSNIIKISYHFVYNYLIFKIDIILKVKDNTRDVHVHHIANQNQAVLVVALLVAVKLFSFNSFWNFYLIY